MIFVIDSFSLTLYANQVIQYTYLIGTIFLATAHFVFQYLARVHFPLLCLTYLQTINRIDPFFMPPSTRGNFCYCTTCSMVTSTNCIIQVHELIFESRYESGILEPNAIVLSCQNCSIIGHMFQHSESSGGSQPFMRY